MRVRVELIVVILLGLLLIPFTPVNAQDGEGNPDAGAITYAENCAVCHGEHGEGRIGATLDDVFVTLDADTMLTQVISSGREGTLMPAWSEANGGPLNDTEIANVIAYIESWGTTYEPPVPAPPKPAVVIPPVAEVDGDPNVGYTLFQQNCAVCHGEDGRGRVGATLTTTFSGIEPGAFAVETISTGVEGTYMPAFAQSNGGPLTDQQINDVAAYVLSQQHPASAPPPAEVTQPASGLPLLAVAVAAIVIIVALGVSVSKGNSEG
jgi:mono/diheme cytochrome c family protein